MQAGLKKGLIPEKLKNEVCDSENMRLFFERRISQCRRQTHSILQECLPCFLRSCEQHLPLQLHIQ